MFSKVSEAEYSQEHFSLLKVIFYTAYDFFYTFLKFLLLQ